MQTDQITKALAVTAEICGTDFSKPAALAIIERLKDYPELAVLKALDRCQTEITGRLTLAAIISRIDDGRPGADEAWSIALDAMDESKTVVMNDEIAEAWGLSASIFHEGDKTGARMSFRSAYDRITANNRAEDIKPKWWPSFGHDQCGREQPIKRAIDQGRLPSSAIQLLPLHYPVAGGQLSLVVKPQSQEYGK